MKMYPDYLPYIVTPVGYDGTSLRSLWMDKQTDGDWSQRVSLIPDRGMSKQLSYLDQSYTNHAWTTRVTYTVPSGKRALLEQVFFELVNPTAGATLKVKVGYLGRPLAQLTVDSSTPATDLVHSQTMNVWLKNGDAITIDTYSGDATSRAFYGAMLLSVFDA